MISVIDSEVAEYVDDLHNVNGIVQNIMDADILRSSKTVCEQCALIEKSSGTILREFHRMGYMHEQRTENKKHR